MTKTRKKIFFLTHEFYPVLSGGTIFAEKMAIELDLLGYDVEIITCGVGKDFPRIEKKQHYTVRRFNTFRKSVSDAKLVEHALFGLFVLPQLFMHLLKERLRQRPEPALRSLGEVGSGEGSLLFSIFAIPAGILGVLVCKLLRIPHVIFVDAADTPGVDSAMQSLIKVLKPLFTWTTKHCEGVVVLEGLEDIACPLITNKNVTIIPNGTTIPTEIANLNADPKKLRILSIGRLVARKSFLDIVEAMAVTKQQTPDFHLTIVGYGGKEADLRTMIAEKGLAEHITLAGRVEYDQLKEYYKNSDCYIFYGGREGSSLAMIEAVSYGLPVIASDHPGNRTFVKNNESGYLVEHGNPSQLGMAVAKLARDRALLQSMGKASRDMALKYSWTNIAKKYGDFFAASSRE
ncbi:MAG: glycosyltransferase family 4 protein [Oligoflexales bacterium]